jgi:hypothetical protein
MQKIRLKTESGGSGDSGGIIPSLKEEKENSSNNSSNEDILSKRYVAFDLEWSQESSHSIFEAAFVDSNGNSKVLHISDYFSNSEHP